ncbi:MAG: hypothetical protein KDD19_28485, partial [Phaeodactylibacter sp.]|nr:hypothetical protein [Phaeodactylibacter sp.]
MERTNFTFVSPSLWLKTLTMVFVFGFWGAQQSFGQCTGDVWAPVIVYPSQDIVVNLDPCDPDPAVVFFEVTVTDDCDGEHFPGSSVVPGSEYTVTASSGGNPTTVFSIGGDRFMGVFGPGMYQIV